MTSRPYIEAKGDLHGRSIPEWIGANADTPVPEKVALRVLLRQSRRCAISGRVIRPGDPKRIDHIIPLKQGGQNRESNLQIILDDEHKGKTAIEAGENAKVERIQRKHYGLRKRSPAWGNRKQKFGWVRP